MPLARLAADIRIALLFCTRLPLPDPGPLAAGDVARASWAFPLAGCAIGCAAAAAYWMATRIGLPPTIDSALTLATTLCLTGCLHEDGLADTADGFGGGRTRERKLEIMRDSRIGTFGACALAMSLLLRWSAMAALREPSAVAVALIASHAAARATAPLYLRSVPPARPDGLAARAGRPPVGAVAAAAVLGAAVLGLTTGLTGAAIGVALLGAATLLMGWLGMRQIGGQTGDTAGALEQIGEVAILLLAVALANPGP